MAFASKGTFGLEYMTFWKHFEMLNDFPFGRTFAFRHTWNVQSHSALATVPVCACQLRNSF